MDHCSQCGLPLASDVSAIWQDGERQLAMHLNCAYKWQLRTGKMLMPVDRNFTWKQIAPLFGPQVCAGCGKQVTGANFEETETTLPGGLKAFHQWHPTCHATMEA